MREREDGPARAAGVGLAASGLLLAAYFVLHPGDGDPAPAGIIATAPLYTAIHALGVVGLIAMLLGLVALYGRLAAGSARLALAGFLLAFVGGASLLGVVYTDAFTFPVVAVHAPRVLDLSGPLYVSVPFLISEGAPAAIWALGLIVLAAAGLRSRQLPVPAAIVLIMAAVVVEVHGPLPVQQGGGVLLGIAFVWAGWVLWRPPVAERRPAVISRAM